MMLVMSAFAAALLHSSLSLASPRTPLGCRMSSIDDRFWSARSQMEAQRNAMLQADLEEFCDRERLYIGRVDALQKEVAELRLLSAAPPEAQAKAPAQLPTYLAHAFRSMYYDCVPQRVRMQ